MNRRQFLSEVAITVAGYAGDCLMSSPRTARADEGPRETSTRLCVADSLWREPGQTAEKIQKRFDQYRKIGFGVLRASVASWDRLESSERHWNERVPEKSKSFLAQAIKSGFRLKLDLQTTSAVPQWWYAAHTDAHILNADGERGGEISLWYPELHAILAEKVDGVFRVVAQCGLFKATDSVFVDLGPAHEPLYPAQWTLGKKDNKGATPWFYDAHAQSAFARAMREKHGSVSQANRLWGTKFADWSDVRLPRPRQHPGTLWDDVLLWYRDSKRDFIRWQVANYQRALKKYVPADTRPKLIVPIGGSHTPAEKWKQVVRSGDPDEQLIVMPDCEFLLDVAKEAGCQLQNGGVENAPEVQYERRYMRDHKNGQPYWGENSGEVWTRKPDTLVDVILAYGLYGLDLVQTGCLWERDTTTPTKPFHALAGACQRLLQAHRQKDPILTFDSLRIDGGDCVHFDPPHSVTLCMHAEGNLVLRKDGRPLWASKTRKTNKSLSCFAIFQGDGNFVVYEGRTKPLWGSNTVSRGKHLVLSTRPPYLAITDARDKIVWSAERK